MLHAMRSATFGRQIMLSIRRNTGNTFKSRDVLKGRGTWIIQPPDLGRRYGGVMRIRRSIILIPAILAFGVAAAAVAGAEVSAATSHASTAHVQTVAVSSNPSVMYHS
jgi:hypothetical protein